MTQTPEHQNAAVSHFPVSVILERRPAVSRWAEHVWNAAGITVGRRGEEREARLIREDQGVAHYMFGGFEVTLHVDECESYYYNLVSDSPRACVVAHSADDERQPQPFLVSMSFDEAHAYLEGEAQIYAVDVPGELYRWTEAFVVANYFPERKKKRKLRDWTADESGVRQS